MPRDLAFCASRSTLTETTGRQHRGLRRAGCRGGWVRGRVLGRQRQVRSPSSTPDSAESPELPVENGAGQDFLGGALRARPRRAVGVSETLARRRWAAAADRGLRNIAAFSRASLVADGFRTATQSVLRHILRLVQLQTRHVPMSLFSPFYKQNYTIAPS